MTREGERRMDKRNRRKREEAWGEEKKNGAGRVGRETKSGGFVIFVWSPNM